MKFSQMQYQRVDFDQLKRDFAELERGLDAAKSGEEQFEIHKKFYEITDFLNFMFFETTQSYFY